MTKTINIKKFVSLGLFGLLFVFIVLYTFFQMKSLSRGVDLKIAGIVDGQIFEKDFIELTGEAIHANLITLNGREVSVDENKNFKENLVLSPGTNIVTLEAKDKYNKKTFYEYRVFYKEKTDTATALNIQTNAVSNYEN